MGKKVETLSYPRGAEWRQWDLHIHSPASFEWKGKRLWEMSASERTASIDAMISALNGAEPQVFALMDYWTFDGWLALQERLKEPGAPKLLKTVFPGIELRLVSPTPYRLNAHVIFSDEVTHQELTDFKSKLEVALIDLPLSSDCLRRLVREKIGADQLKTKGFERASVLSNDVEALMAGSKCAEVTLESYRGAIERAPPGKALGFIPWDPSDGLAKADWKTHYAYVIGLMKTSPIFETRKEEMWAAFVGVRTEGNADWYDAFQVALDRVPRLAVSGSDSHSYANYGQYPNGKATWIKSDPTFLGLQQALKEPRKRSYIGPRPPKLDEVSANKTFYIDRVEIAKSETSTLSERWLQDCRIPLNYDLVAIIGNKGSGKSALADAIALLGDSKQKEHFSFLSSKRFRARPKELARHFMGRLTWKSTDGEASWRPLCDDPPASSVELVRYIPQAHFEKLCNDHASGKSDVFEKELRAVIFSHASPALRLSALDFDQLIEQQEDAFRAELGELRKDLRRLNQDIESAEAQLQPGIRESLGKMLHLKERQIEEHEKIPHDLPATPPEALTAEQQAAQADLKSLSERLNVLDSADRDGLAQESSLAARVRALQSVRERLRILKRQFKQFETETAADLAMLGLQGGDLVTLEIRERELDKRGQGFPDEEAALVAARAARAEAKAELTAQAGARRAELNEPQVQYQKALEDLRRWQERLAELRGATDAPETLEGLKARLRQLDELPKILQESGQERLKLCGDIFDILERQRRAREELFRPVQDVIQQNDLIRDDYKLQFQATLGSSPEALAGALFSLIKQNSGEFRGEDESFATVRRIAEKHPFGDRASALAFVEELHSKILEEAHDPGVAGIGIAPILRSSRSPSGANKSVCDVYDLLYGLSFLEPRYSLLFQDTQIEQLSPGQRGALLLIFYLLVDKGRNPIILDQPEENLDNETVVSLLVPVLNEAKSKRQIIMVTHNPNLAVVCDAEQVIYSAFDRKDQCTIVYTSGSIENPNINRHVVNVLEGTRPAFENRRTKYH